MGSGAEGVGPTGTIIVSTFEDGGEAVVFGSLISVLEPPPGTGSGPALFSSREVGKWVFSEGSVPAFVVGGPRPVTGSYSFTVEGGATDTSGSRAVTVGEGAGAIAGVGTEEVVSAIEDKERGSFTDTL